MANTMTITKAVQIAKSPEALQAMDLVQVEKLIEVLATSGDKKVTRLMDMVKGTLEAKRKAAKPEEKEAIKAVENSVKEKAKVKSKTIKPKAKAVESAEEKADKEAIKAAEALAKQEAKKEQAKAEVKTEEKPSVPSKAKGDGFPEVGPGNFERIMLNSVDDIKAVIVARPYELVLFMQEKNVETLSAFRVVYANDDVMVLVDISIELNSVVPIDMKTFKKGKVKFDGTNVPVAFYLPPTK